MAILAALDALKHGGIPLKNNLKFIFEGEEEAGSTHLRLFCEERKDLLESDVLFIVNHDNNQHQPNENLRIGHLWTGIETFAAVIMMGR